MIAILVTLGYYYKKSYEIRWSRENVHFLPTK